MRCELSSGDTFQLHASYARLTCMTRVGQAILNGCARRRKEYENIIAQGRKESWKRNSWLTNSFFLFIHTSTHNPLIPLILVTNLRFLCRWRTSVPAAARAWAWALAWPSGPRRSRPRTPRPCWARACLGPTAGIEGEEVPSWLRNLEQDYKNK